MTCSYGKCKNEVKWRYSPDLDITGLLSCDEHKETVQMAYIALLQGTEDICYSLLRRKKPTD